MLKYANADSAGPTVVQQHLRDLAQGPCRRAAGTNMEEGPGRAVSEDASGLDEELLEFQDVTDFHRSVIIIHQAWFLHTYMHTSMHTLIPYLPSFLYYSYLCYSLTCSVLYV